MDEFDDVRDGDILVCQMTNPAWVVLFTKIAGLVTDTGGTTSHPAVLAREFGIPAVIGTSVATQRIVTGDRVRVDGGAGRVEILRGEPSDAARLAGRRDRALTDRPWRIARIIPRSVLADQVKDRLLEGILNGYYPPDSRIVETQVARELGTSQAPVREALRGLEALGVVEITPFRGARVRRPSRREILEAYVVRSALEVLAARLAVPRLTDADVAELAGYARGDASARPRDDDGHGVAEADARFHGRIVELADNGTLERVWSTLEPFSRTYITLVVPGADPQWSADLHAPILDGHRAPRHRGRRRRPRAPLRRGPRRTWPAAGPTTHRRPRPNRPARHEGRMSQTLQLSEEMSAGAARLRIDVHGAEPLEHVLDDMTFLNYRLADVRISPEVTARRARHPLAAGRREGRSPTTAGR